MLQVLKQLLLKIISDIDAGNSNCSEAELKSLVEIVKSYTDKTRKLSKYQSCSYLNVSRATFDNYVRAGLLPRGSKEQGFKELFWTLKDLDRLLETKK